MAGDSNPAPSSPPSGSSSDQQNAPSNASSSRNRAPSGPTAPGILRSASNKFFDSNVPLGMWSATGTVAARAPSLADIRRNSQGSRRGSSTSIPRSHTLPPSTPDLPGSPVKNRPERTRTGSSGKLDKITSDEKEDDFPWLSPGRGELNDQSFVRGQKQAQTTTRVPKLAVRGRDAKDKETGSLSNEKPHSSTDGPSDSKSQEQKEVEDNGTEEGEDVYYDLDENLEHLVPRPKRSSKNVDAMLGRTPAAAPSSEPNADSLTKGKEPESKVNTPDAKEPFPDFDDDEDDLGGLMPQPKRSSKNVDKLLGRTPDKPAHIPATVADESSAEDEPAKPEPNAEGVYPNGYAFPPKKTWSAATLIGLKAFLRFTFTPLGFFIVLYGLNVVAWGGMLFLLLCNASPWMCTLGDGTYDCNNINSPRRVWVEIDSQILNSLFCVTGFGLIPWRFRDFYYLLKWRVGKKEAGLRKLAGYHSGWFRLPGSDRLPAGRNYGESQLWEDESNPALPIPLKRAPGPPLTGARAPPTPLWKMDFVIWAFVWNTFLQACLSGFMWGLNRYDRPSWSTGLFVALACIVAAMGGLMQFFEGKKIKKVEGIPLESEERIEDIEKNQEGSPGSTQRSEEPEVEGREGARDEKAAAKTKEAQIP